MPTVEELETQVRELRDLVQKQQGMLAKTGQQVLELGISRQKQNISELDSKNKDLRAAAKLDPEDKPDTLTQDDVVQLVGELQGQLDLLDERGMLRISNSQARAQQSIDAVPNAVGDLPEQFPSTYEEFEKLEDSDILELAKFYELVAPGVTEVKAMLAEAEVPLHSAEAKEAIENAERSEKEINVATCFNSLAKYLGLSARK